ncbi:hemagglutinin repeat-containing protein [Telmatospirillum siberiense]|uniref:hemagglutinin repeat-containing protein n=1 Tax=Telmatospirillum siberiense TaxID=382514 RepID=UPI00130448C8|nr:hemagglutinin repeat-containing protein [Telmatospirillum siberiense]
MSAKDTITDVSGLLKAGGDVSLTAGKDVSIATRTVTLSGAAGDDRTVRVGQGAVTAGGNLTVSAGNDVTVTGADLSAKGGASVTAGGAVTLTSGTDLTLQAAQVTAGGDLSLSAGGTLSLLSATDSSYLSQTSSKSSAAWQSTSDKGHSTYWLMAALL